ncbi:FecR family protein [Pedobacter sp. JY14-1]|uniref:FecR family protein n=1 Tax=Pedobacter sp. JY14-1 TaxID=3034151 RepID=UPI0023E1A94B|nr:FecR family protein [Pedobacter sp. JY14-1]
MAGIAGIFEIGRVIARHLAGKLDREEQELLETWLAADVRHVEIFRRITDQDSLSAALLELEHTDVEGALARVKARIEAERLEESSREAGTESDQGHRGRTVRLWPWTGGQSKTAAGSRKWIAGLAAAVATIVFGVWLYKYEVASQAHHDGVTHNGELVNDVAPGKYGATITLANGQVIQLDSAKKGVVVGVAAGATALRYDDGSALSSLRGGTTKQSPDEIASEAAQPRNDGKGGYDGKEQSKAMMLTATTARGQTYSFTLPDGTKVWLNADSRLEFPAQFSGNERKILLQGEAYFVVVHNDKQPFRVVSKRPDGRAQVVEDIGTEFNINAYADERSVKTTLVEGAASVSSLLSSSSLRGGTTRQSSLQGEIASKAAHSRNDGKGALEMTGNSKDKRSLTALEMTGNSNDSRGGEIASKAAHSRNDGQGVILTPNQQASLTNGGLKVKTVDTETAVAWRSGKLRFENASLEEVMRQLSRWYNVEVKYPEGVPELKFTGGINRNVNASVALDILRDLKVKFKIEGKTIIVSK